MFVRQTTAGIQILNSINHGKPYFSPRALSRSASRPPAQQSSQTTTKTQLTSLPPVKNDQKTLTVLPSASISNPFSAFSSPSSTVLTTGRILCSVANSFAARSSAVEPIVDPSNSMFLRTCDIARGIEGDAVLCMFLIGAWWTN
jgi:hypothetical protein